MNALEQMKMLLTSPPVENPHAVTHPMTVYSVGVAKLASSAIKNWNPNPSEHIWGIHDPSYTLMAVGTRAFGSDEWVWHTISTEYGPLLLKQIVGLMHEAMDELGITYYPDTPRDDLIRIRTVGVVGWMMGATVPWANR